MRVNCRRTWICLNYFVTEASLFDKIVILSKIVIQDKYTS